MAYKLKNGKIYRAEVVNLHPAMRAFTDSFIVSNYTVSKLYHCIRYSVKNRILCGKKLLSQPRKGILVIIVPQLDVVVSDFCGETSTQIKKTERASK